jgi:predicted membrane-bound mannosyltransferase
MAKKGKKARVERPAQPAKPAQEETVSAKKPKVVKEAVKKEKKARADAPKFVISDKTWRNSAIAITAIGAFLRFAFLAIKPFHHDEGVNGFFLTNLIKDANYHYDPANYHGPTLYF